MLLQLRGMGLKYLALLFSPYPTSPYVMLSHPATHSSIYARADRHLGPLSVGLRPPDPAVEAPTPGRDGQLQHNCRENRLSRMLRHLSPIA